MYAFRHLTLFTWLFCSTAATAFSADQTDGHSIKISDSLTCTLELAPQARFSLQGLAVAPKADFAEFFQVVVHRASEQETPAILGTYDVQGDTLRFYPRFPLDESVTYAVRLGSAISEVDAKQPLLFALPRSEREPRRVAAVYPSASHLPENVLKFYIHFSGPMNRGEAYKRIRLYRGEQLVEDPFLELGEELWDPRQTRFTLFIHPGRLKRGLKPREDSGPAIATGAEYALKISDAWTAANGQPLASEFVKRFSVLPADHDQPDLERWQITTPPKNSQDPVSLRFNEPLDHAMLSRVLTVKNRQSETVDGDVKIGEAETVWEFVPEKAWSVGTYQIEVAANLEDLCGNSIARPFEVKMQQGAAALPATKVAIEFIVK